MIYLELFLGFLIVGCFSFGGAYGAIPLIKDVVLSYGWASDEMFTYFVAVSESTPGPIMVNLATYIGSSQGGFWGAIIATLAVVMPSFLIIVLIVTVLKKVLDYPFVQACLNAIGPCVIGIIFATGIAMIGENILPEWRKNLMGGVFLEVDFMALLIMAVLLLVSYVYKKKKKKPLPPIRLIMVAAVLGMIFY